MARTRGARHLAQVRKQLRESRVEAIIQEHFADREEGHLREDGMFEVAPDSFRRLNEKLRASQPEQRGLLAAMKDMMGEDVFREAEQLQERVEQYRGAAEILKARPETGGGMVTDAETFFRKIDEEDA